MNQGKSRFDFQLNKIENLINTAKTQENPALWLFQNEMRTPMFMLEALSKMYATWHDKKKFTALRNEFKAFEDILGAIDYYEAFRKEFAGNQKIPAPIKIFLDINVKQNTKKFNDLLITGKWLTGKGLKDIKDRLKAVDWEKEGNEVAFLKDFYQKQIQKIKTFVFDTDFLFKNVESDVHELRRKLRWLSIYPHALQGAVVLQEDRPAAENLKKYLTPDVISSPYNKLPAPTDSKNVLILETNHFFALSSMIAQLGKLKDNGLRISILKDALQATSSLDDASSLNKVYNLLGKDYPRLETLLSDASTLAKQYFEENNLDRLVKSSNGK